MENSKVLELEKRLDSLLVTARVSKWWAAAIVAAIISLIGINSVYLLPKYVYEYLKSDAVSQLRDEIKSSVDMAKKDQVEISNIRKNLNSIENISLYVCPRLYDNISSSWASFGCVGQISSLATCENIFWASKIVVIPHECKKLPY